jgi:hypothetical protein
MTDIYDEMEQAGKGLRMGDLEGETFTITALEETTSRFTDDQGRPKRQYKATILREGEDAEGETLWLTGGTVGQCDLLVDRDALPIVVKIIGEGKQGSPYKLGRPDENGEQVVPPTPSRAPAVKSPVGAWAPFLTEAKRLGLKRPEIHRYFGAEDVEGGLAVWAAQESKRTRKAIHLVIQWMTEELGVLATQLAEPPDERPDEPEDELPFEPSE